MQLSEYVWNTLDCATTNGTSSQYLMITYHFLKIDVELIYHNHHLKITDVLIDHNVKVALMIPLRVNIDP